MDPIVEIDGLEKHFVRRGLPFIGRKEIVRAVDGVSLSIRRGETFGLVGESGSGKSTLGRAILDLVPATAGRVRFEGEDLATLPKPAMRLLRRRMQIVFQDPYGSLNPRMTVGQALREGARAGGIATADLDRKVAGLMTSVGLGPAQEAAYPHRLSGGQRQRVAIARSLSVGPSFIVADEPVSALDLSIQAQILNLLADLQTQYGLTYLFISHDLRVIRYLADRVAVMYRGRIVEQAPAAALFATPRHPYTRLLLDTLPSTTRIGAGRGAVSAISVPETPASGCSFAPRCALAEPGCRLAQPPSTEIAPDHQIACFVAARHELTPGREAS